LPFFGQGFFSFIIFYSFVCLHLLLFVLLLLYLACRGQG
jgi:hypothetical protein